MEWNGDSVYSQSFDLDCSENQGDSVGYVCYKKKLTSKRVSLCRLANGYVDDLDILLRLLLVHPSILDLVNNVKSLISPSENGVLLVQPKSLLGSDEELRSIGVRTSISHANSVWLVMSQ